MDWLAKGFHMQISRHKVVTVENTLTGADGTILDTSDGQGPLAYIHGIGDLVPGLEAALEGKDATDHLEVIIAPDQGYGERDESLMQTVSREQFQDVDELEVGTQFEVGDDDGDRVVTVVKMENDEVTIDGNHPLAGQTLNFSVNIIEVREATPEELDHGHAHGCGGHHH